MQIFVRRNAVVGKSESLMRGACAAFLFSLGFFFFSFLGFGFCSEQSVIIRVFFSYLGSLGLAVSHMKQAMNFLS